MKDEYRKLLKESGLTISPEVMKWFRSMIDIFFEASTEDQKIYGTMIIGALDMLIVAYSTIIGS